jgi:hypothetical protein
MRRWWAGRLASTTLVVCLASAATVTLDAHADSDDENDDGLLPGAGSWRAVTGLRIDQEATPRNGGLALGVRLTLPEMARGALSVETFRWERLDVTEDQSALGEDDGTTYQVVGLRRRFEGTYLGAFTGAHVMSWSDGEARGFTPWFGARLGPADGTHLEADARLLGVAALDPRAGAGVGDHDVTLRAASLPFPHPRWRLGARARLRDLGKDGGRRRDTSAALGVELFRGGRPIFVGLGVQRHQVTSAAPPDAMVQAAGVMPTAVALEPDTTIDTTVLLQVEVDMALPTSLPL